MSLLLKHFGLTHQPFGRSTPQEAVYRHQGFEEALTRLRLTLELDDIGMLVAEPGCGKSLLLGELADGLLGDGWAVHYFAHSTVGPFSLVNVLARKAGVAPRRSRGETALALSEALIRDERHHALMLDEAHALPDATLQDIRLLTIGDFDRKSPFLLLLAGKPTLNERLAEPPHHALDQRITTVARLQPLSADETRDYVKKRLSAAGANRTPLFEDGAIDALFDSSGGVPRRVNSLATAALIVAAARKRRVVCEQDVVDARIDRGRP